MAASGEVGLGKALPALPAQLQHYHTNTEEGRFTSEAINNSLVTDVCSKRLLETTK